MAGSRLQHQFVAHVVFALIDRDTAPLVWTSMVSIAGNPFWNLIAEFPLELVDHPAPYSVVSFAFGDHVLTNHQEQIVQ